ncbi:MAG: type II secretion system F family protein [Planctomycetota bacterium]
MPIYSYKAVTDQLALIQGSIAADSPRQARDQLRRRGLSIEALREQASTKGKRPWFGRRASRYETQLVPAVREIATLLSASIPLADALQTVASQQKKVLGNSLSLVCDRVNAGASLAEAMREQPHIYDPLTIQLVEVGQSAGTLDVVLDQLADFRERYLQFKDRVLTSLFYPMFVAGTSLAVTLFLMTFVVPMLLDNLLESGKEIPLPTRILKGASDLLRGHGLLLAIGSASIFPIALLIRSTKAGTLAWHSLLMRLPLFGKLTEKQELARAALIISTLMESGIVFLESLSIASRAIKNVVLRKAFEQVHDQVQTGVDIGQAMEETGRFPATVVQIFAVGQQTGKLESMLQRLASDYDRQVTSMSARLASVLEPMLIVFLALFVGFILYATMLPILEAGNVL